jgi:hypothetical protein
MKYIYDLHQTMLAQSLILVYEGEFTQEITKSVLAMAERNLDSTGEESGIKRKVFNIMVECLQNVVKHSDEVEPNQSAIFMIGRQQEEYIIMSGNPMKKENVDSLKERLDKINSLDKDGLKNLYRDIIKNTRISDKGGAGLGFIDMARKSGRKLEYDFYDLDEKCSFFCLRSTIGRAI